MRLFPTPPYRDVQELLDRAGEATESELVQTLRDIRRANIFGLGTWVVLRHLGVMLADWPKDRTVHVLDLATGSADIPQAICKWADKNGLSVRITGSDISAEILQVAKDRISKAGLSSRVDFVTCDAAKTPFGPGSFDVVICSLAFHHLNVKQARAVLPQMAALARKGFIINDIYRSQGAWLMAWVLAHLSTTNRLTRHDGPASVYRAYTPREYRRLAVETGVPLQVYKHPFWRVAAVGRSLE